MDHPLAIDQAEIVQQAPITVNGLGPDTRPARSYIVPPELWNQASQIAGKHAPAEGPAVLLQAHPPVASGKLTEPRKHDHLQGIPQGKAEAPVSFPLESQNRIGAGLQFAAAHAGEMHTQKRKCRVRDRIDQVFHQSAARRFNYVIFSPEGNDVHIRGYAAEAGQAVALQAGAIDQEAAGKIALCGTEHESALLSGNALHGTGGTHQAAMAADDLPIG